MMVILSMWILKRYLQFFNNFHLRTQIIKSLSPSVLHAMARSSKGSHLIIFRSMRPSENYLDWPIQFLKQVTIDMVNMIQLAS